MSIAFPIAMIRGAAHHNCRIAFVVGLACSLICSAVAADRVEQSVFGLAHGRANTTATELGKTWEAIGPFPSGTREHPFLSSPIYAFLHNRSYTSSDHELAFDRGFFPAGVDSQSPLCKKNRCPSRIFDTGDDGWTEIKYPDVRWEQLRSDQGWSALQYQTLLRTNLTVSSTHQSQRIPLRIELVQGTEVALVSRDRPLDSVAWYNGDVYAYAETVSSGRKRGIVSSLAREIMVEAGEYVVLVRAMYEIRMFGDPGRGKSGPVIRFRLGIEPGQHEMVEHVGELDTVADIVGGIYMGEAMGVGLRTSAENEGVSEVVGVKLTEASEEMANKAIRVEMVLKRFTLAAGQTRILSLSILQDQPLLQAMRHLNITVSISIGPQNTPTLREITICVPLHHLRHWSASHHPIRFTHLTATSPTWAILLPPSSAVSYAPESQQPTLLALHGAGVLANSNEWIESIPDRPKGWAVLPTGLTEWGMDWHGISMESALQALKAARRLVEQMNGGQEVNLGGKAWHFSEKTILLGHSNGGQGAWHLAARYPDEFVGVIPAAGFVKIQNYVHYQSWTSGSFADPAMMAILHSSLTPYDNDLYASNLARLPVLAVHGEEDDNVPVYHSRVHTALVDAWRRIDNGSRYDEITGRNHWWPEVFRSDSVEAFLHKTSQPLSSAADLTLLTALYQEGFTVTTANPQESGGLGGIRIVELEVPGRLARIEVKGITSADRSVPRLKLTNVQRFTIGPRVAQLFSHLEMERQGRPQPVNLHHCAVAKGTCSFSTQTGMMDVTGDAINRSYGPMIRILSGTAPLIFVVGTGSASRAASASIAARLAHDVLVYYRLDTEILTDDHTLRLQAEGLLGEGNIVVIGSPRDNLFARWMITNTPSPITFHPDGTFQLQDGLFYERSTGLLALQPHPSTAGALACIIAGTDEDGWEMAARLFPIRTGVPVPEWVVVGATSQWQGAGGFLGAGFWDNKWKWSEAMSYLI